VDIVVPSLPGFAFSGKPQQIIGRRATAALWLRLMTEVLGYGEYLVQGGDWGSVVTSWLGIDHVGPVRAIHLNTLPLQTAAPAQNEAEVAWLAEIGKRGERLNGYCILQFMKPQSIDWATAGNPLGQESWIVERFHDWTYMSYRELEDAFSLDHLLTNAMNYVMTDSVATGAWYYNGLIKACRFSGRQDPCLSAVAG
jgi:pimeloyl-ACP methyl ester carboxylesterase